MREKYKKILILESHFDDAWINCGGYILANSDISFDVVTLSSSKEKNDAHESISLKKYVKNIENYHDLGFEDIQFSRENNKKYLCRDLKDVFREVNENQNAYEDMKEKIQNIILETRPDCIFYPLGIQHNMHRLSYTLGREIDFKNKAFYYDHPYVDKKMNKIEVSLKLKEILGEALCFRLDGDLVSEKLKIFQKVYKTQWYQQSAVKSIIEEIFIFNKKESIIKV